MILKTSNYVKELFLSCSITILVISLLTTSFFDANNTGFQYLFELSIWDVSILCGIDSISISFIILTSCLTPLCLLYNWNTTNNVEESNLFFSIFFFLEILLIFVFLVLDLIAFYIVFEFILIPFYIIIVLHKNNYYVRNNTVINRKMHSFYLLFFYTISGSLMMLIGILALYAHTGSTIIPLIWYYKFDFFTESILWYTFFISFCIKIPIIPFHLWLPEAHVEAPTEGSVLLASVLLKIGTYGFLRILIPSFPQATIFYSIFVWLLCIFSIISTAMSASIQIDIKRIIAYASIGHMNICVLGLFTTDVTSIAGSIVLLLAHGFTSAGLFFCIGILYNRFHTKNFKYFNGVVILMPMFSLCIFLFILSNFSIPGTLNFIGEVLIFTSFFKNNFFFIQICVFIAILLSSFYSINLLNRLLFANTNSSLYYTVKDLSIFEFIILIFLLCAIYCLGILPSYMLDILMRDIHYYFLY